MRDFMPVEFHPAFDAYLERIAVSDSDDGLVQMLSRDGQVHVLQYRNVRSQEPGEGAYVLSHAADITDRMRVEQILREQNAY
ncbi:MAG: sensor domain-containing diguanylate cyclase, partial [Chloroflexi bacterium]